MYIEDYSEDFINKNKCKNAKSFQNSSRYDKIYNRTVYHQSISNETFLNGSVISSLKSFKFNHDNVLFNLFSPITFDLFFITHIIQI